jgi:hypothetical protein
LTSVLLARHRFVPLVILRTGIGAVLGIDRRFMRVVFAGEIVGQILLGGLFVRLDPEQFREFEVVPGVCFQQWIKRSPIETVFEAGDGGTEDSGAAAAAQKTGSPIEPGLRGTFRRARFIIQSASIQNFGRVKFVLLKEDGGLVEGYQTRVAGASAAE